VLAGVGTAIGHAFRTAVRAAVIGTAITRAAVGATVRTAITRAAVGATVLHAGYAALRATVGQPL
jgi:hypothetical protein